jgi:hypothetical protein
MSANTALVLITCIPWLTAGAVIVAAIRAVVEVVRIRTIGGR